MSDSGQGEERSDHEFVLQLQNLSYSIKKKHILKDINLQIKTGEFVSILGASGCGKSTLLRLIAQFVKPTNGKIFFAEANRSHFGFVFQESNLLPWRTVEENLKLPFEIRKSNRKNDKLSAIEISSRIDEELNRVGLSSVKKAFPNELSGGMKMRLALARALIEKPNFLLLDEPLAALDETTRFQLQSEIRTLSKKLGMTVLFVTHSITEAVFISDRIFMLRSLGSNENSMSNDSKSQIAAEFDLKLELSRDDTTRSNPNYLEWVKKISTEFRGIK